MAFGRTSRRCVFESITVSGTVGEAEPTAGDGNPRAMEGAD